MKIILKSKRIILPLLVTILTLFMGICYASVNTVLLDISGSTEAIIPKDLIITNVTTSDENNTIINSYDKTVLNSKVILSDTDINSEKSFEITIYNNSENPHFFKNIVYALGEITYSNSNIEFILDNRLSTNYKLESKSSVTFTLTFRYKEEYKLNHKEKLENELNSILSFKFGHTIVSFDINGGNPQEISSFFLDSTSKNTILENEIPSRTGYIFMGWYDGIDYKNSQMYFDENQKVNNLNDINIEENNITLYAGWNPITYTITYNLDGYIPLEYIESTGEQYIDTGVLPNTNTKIETEIYGIYEDGAWYGGRDSSQIGIYNYNGGFDFGTQGLNSRIYTSPEDNKWHTISHSRQLIIDDVFIKEYTTGNFSSSKNLYLFAGNNGGTAWSFSSIKMKETKIYDANTLIRDFIPAKMINNKRVGFYDIVEDKFYTSLGYENFIEGPTTEDSEITKNVIDTIKYDETYIIRDYKGNNSSTFIGWSTDCKTVNYKPKQEIINLSSTNNDNINLCPIFSDYISLEYIESNGEQYIDTGIFPNQNTRIETEIYGNFEKNAWYGGRSTTYIGIYNYNGGFDFGTQGLNSRIYINPENDKWHTISHSRKLIIDGDLLNEYSTENFSSPQTLTLFAGNAGGAIMSFSSIKMKETKIYYADTLVRDFIPSKMLSSNKVGFYDVIENKFYESLGSGNFIAGPEIEE